MQIGRTFVNEFCKPYLIKNSNKKKKRTKKNIILSHCFNFRDQVSFRKRNHVSPCCCPSVVNYCDVLWVLRVFLTLHSEDETLPHDHLNEIFFSGSTSYDAVCFSIAWDLPWTLLPWWASNSFLKQEVLRVCLGFLNFRDRKLMVTRGTKTFKVLF